MSRREPMHDLENGLAGPVELDAASGAEGAAAPDWVTLLPAGPDIAGRSGRRFQLPREAAEAVVAAFRTNGADLPVDLEHSTEIKGPKGEAAPAVGWIKELRVTGAGAVEGRVDWTGAGRGLLAERADRYLSPSVVFDRASRTIRRLVSAGLTNKPDFRMPALAREDGADGPGDAPDAAGPLAGGGHRAWPRCGGRDRSCPRCHCDGAQPGPGAFRARLRGARDDRRTRPDGGPDARRRGAGAG
jgi:hypothetical protein